MKITSFNPQIVAKDAAPIVQFFEELGFERHHHKTDIGELNVENIQLKDPNGFKIDISQPEQFPVHIPADAVVCIRINVDDFEEAYALFTARGFRNFYNDHEALTPTSRNVILIAPSGFAVNLIKHIK